MHSQMTCAPAMSAKSTKNKNGRMQWSRYPEALAYLRSKLDEFRATKTSDRMKWYEEVGEHVTTAWQFDCPAGDVRKVCQFCLCYVHTRT